MNFRSYECLGENKGILMIKCIPLLLLLGASLASLGQEPPMSIERYNWGYWVRNEHYLNQFVDSLEDWRIGKPVPAFLFDPIIDWKKRSRIGVLKIKSFSFRKTTLDRTHNLGLLAFLVNSPDERLDKLYDPKVEKSKSSGKSIHPSLYPTIPFMESSTRDLARKRLSELNKGCFVRDRTLKSLGEWFEVELIINSLADSLNCMVRPPSYLFDPSIDLKFRDITKSCVSAEKTLISIRKVILDRVHNQDALKTILDNPSKLLDSLYVANAVDNANSTNTDRPRIPYMKYSTRFLVKERLLELRGRDK